MSAWEGSDSDVPAKSANSAAKPTLAVKKPVKTKWEGEDEEDDGPVSDWEESSDEEEEERPTSKAAPAPLPPSKNKGITKTKIAEKEAAKRKEDDLYDSDDVLDPREKARRDKEKELKADLHNAVELFGTAVIKGSSSSELDSLLSFDPRTKDDFNELSSRIINIIIKRHQNKPLYPAFIEHHVRELALPLKDVEVRKAASGLTTLANEKQKEAKDKASGKKKPKAKPGLGLAKTNKIDTSTYDDAYDDFGNNPDDFI